MAIFSTLPITRVLDPFWRRSHKRKVRWIKRLRRAQRPILRAFKTNPLRDGRSKRILLALVEIGPGTARHLGVPRLHWLETSVTRRTRTRFQGAQRRLWMRQRLIFVRRG